jgi:acyl-coenzyme A thioesterase PaaI-like protein
MIKAGGIRWKRKPTRVKPYMPSLKIDVNACAIVFSGGMDLVNLEGNTLQGSAFQDQIPDNYCWGCGPLNTLGLQIKSYWSGEESVCNWQPDPRFMAGPQQVLNGGIIGTLIDCHCICTAIAASYRKEGRPIGNGPLIWYATASLNVTYRRPTPVADLVTLRARITATTDRKTVLSCTLITNGEARVAGEVTAVRVRPEWLTADHKAG